MNNASNQRKVLEKALSRYDELWEEWKELYNLNPLCATIYTELSLWDRREGSIGEFVDNSIRIIVGRQDIEKLLGKLPDQ